MCGKTDGSRVIDIKQNETVRNTNAYFSHIWNLEHTHMHAHTHVCTHTYIHTHAYTHLSHLHTSTYIHTGRKDINTEEE